MPPPSTARAPWYSFDAGPVHFVALSTENDLSAVSSQVAWLTSDLAANTRPWTVVSAHRFMYISSSSPADAGAAAALRAAVEPLFARFSVDVVLTGHHHSFQRTCPVLYGACVNSSATRAPVYLITGGAGAGLSALAPTQPDYIAFAADEHSYLAVRADRAAMVLTAKRTVDGSVLDETVLTKA